LRDKARALITLSVDLKTGQAIINFFISNHLRPVGGSAYVG
jgi:hypothetical protein